MADGFIRVAVLCATDLEYPRSIIVGVRRFASSDKRWIFSHLSSSPQSVEALHAFQPHGVIAQVGGTHVRDALLGLGRPAVNVSGRRNDVPLPRVGVDDAAVGRIAAEYFLGRGYHHFAFSGYVMAPGDAYVPHRHAGFVAALEGRGVVLVDDKGVAGNPGSKAYSRWLADLPKPVGLLAANDSRARVICDQCRELNIRVPEDIAIVGVDNDELICGLTYPPLSSVNIGADRVGFEAAALLERLMRGEAPPTDPVLIPPLGVVTRQSSDALAVKDPAVNEAVRFIWQNVERGINVEDVAGELAVSRRWLEHVFRRSLGRTPGEEIRRVRLARARELLASTDLSMPEIARRVGFSDARRLSVVFRHELKTTPTAYRRQSRAEGSLRPAAGG